MSTLPDNELDLEKLFLPSWAQEPSSTKNYENFKGEEPAFDRRERRPGGGPRREGGFGQRPRRDSRPEGRRPEGQPRQGQPARTGDQPRGPRPQGGPGGDRRGFDRPQGQGRRDQAPRRELPPPLPEISISLTPEEKGVDILARQIKMTGRAYPLFDIAQMILQKPERHTAAFAVRKNAEGNPVQPLFLCALDDTLWLSDDEAVDHVLKRHFATFYQAERTATEPPKGKYTFVAQCGMSGIIFGPPNHHDYQNQLRKLHADRFSRMPFEMYKSRVRIVRDEEVVKKWVEDQSWKTEYICLNVPDALRLETMEAVAQHFRETHKESIIKQVEAHTITGASARNLRSPDLSRLYRTAWEDQKRFPLQIATVLSQQFASRGLQFFKVNKTLTHVSVARPHYLDLEATPVSEGVRKIVQHLNNVGKCSRRQLMDALIPAPAIKLVPITAPAPETPPAAEDQPAPDQAAPPPAPAAQSDPPPEQTALISDLHWLIHQGHVIEFANGVMETAKKPLPKPQKPEKKPAAPAEATAQPPPEPSSEPTPEPAAPETVAEVASPSAEAPSTVIDEPAPEAPIPTDPDKPAL
jgi:hypothetical protein